MKIINTADYTTEDDLSTLSDLHRESMYNGLDVCVTLEVFYALEAEMDETSRQVYQRSLDLRGPILEMSMHGIRVDLAKRDVVLAQFRRTHKQLEEQLNAILGDGLGVTINYRSGKQLANVLYDILGLKPIRQRNAEGKYVPTVGRDALERLSIYFWAQPIANHVLALRDLDKKISFLKTGVDPDGRMRATFNIAGTNTGRLSSSASEFGTGTNQQNIDRSLKSIFIPDDGMKFVNIDLEQGDSRNLGALCWEHFAESHGEDFAGAYLNACESGDLHTTVCRMAWADLDWPADDAPLAAFKAVAEQIFYRQDTYRQMAKKLGHGTNFLGQPHTMAMHTKTPQNIIAGFQRRYFGAFPCIPQYHAFVENSLNEHSALTTLHGRRRFFFGRRGDKQMLREAVAYSPQSMTADAVNKAMIQIWQADRAQILCQVHDSLLMQVPEDECHERVAELLELGRAPLALARGREFVVPNEAKVGFNWGDKKEDNELGLTTWKADAPDERRNEKKKLSLLNR